MGNDERQDGTLYDAVYDHLRAIARRRMAGERPGHTLQTTALVHETYLKLEGEGLAPDRSHFFVAAARAMRQILIDHARRRGCAKRGGGFRRMPLDVLDLAREADLAEIVAVDEAISRLGEVDARAAEVVRLRFFAGASPSEVAGSLDCSLRTVERDWTYARAWLQKTLTAEDA